MLLLAVVALAASGIQTAAAVALKETLDANWRGAYDIVVTAGSAEGQLEGLLPPNSLAGAERLTLDDLESIRAVAGIEVAAPIGEMALPALFGAGASITIPAGESGAGAEPQSFRVTVSYRTDDGLGERIVSQDTTDIVIDETGRNRPPITPPTGGCNINGFDVDREKYPLLYAQCGGFGHEDYVIMTDHGNGWGASGSLDDAVHHFSFTSAPATAGRITLVDPAAEQALLGDAGAFLAPLVSLNPRPVLHDEALDAWATSTPGRFADSVAAAREEHAAQQSGFGSAEYYTEFKRLYEENGADFEEYTGPPTAYVPLLVSEVSAAPLTVEVSVEAFGPATYSSELREQHRFPYLVSDTLRDGSSGVPLGTNSVDASGLINSFAQSNVTVPWPGTAAAPPEFGTFPGIYIQSTGTTVSASYRVVSRSGDETTVRLSAQGFRQPTILPGPSGSGFSLSGDGTTIGSESAYSSSELLGTQEFGQLAVAVGGFDASVLADLQSELSYVPLGAYQAVGSTVVGGSGDRVTETAQLNPSVSGLGLVSQQTLAIGSIHSAEAWGQDAPINAVRVRVGDVTDYSDAAKQKIAEVAQSIAALGFTATIVAGSSPTAVTVQVDDYAFGVTDIAEKQEVGLLGEVIQEWSELGAAARAEVAISTANLAILGIALGSTAILLGAVQFASVPRRRTQAAVLRSLGWTRGRILRWMAAEEVPGIAVVAAAGVAATLLSGSSRLVMTIALLGLLTAVLTSLAAVVLGSRLERQKSKTGTVDPRGRRRLKFRGRSIAAFGARQGRIHVLTSTTHFIAILIVAAAAAGIVLVFHEGRVAGGSSLLAQFTAAQAVLPQFALGASAIAAGVILAVLGRRVDLARRAQQWATMRGIGWTSGQVRAAQRVEAATVVLPAVVFATAAAAALAIWLELGPVLLLVAAAAAGAALVALVVVSVGRKALP